MKKVYDLCVKVGSYEKDGQTKNQYENIGAIMEREDGGRFIFLNRYFNPAGIPNPDNRTNIIVSMFENKNQQFQGPKVPESNEPVNDDIPF